ncbi:MAG: hypothetical protein ACT4OY_06490 [Alphaproteobacteria bacterium]
MTSNYAEARIHEALRLSGGDIIKAREQVVAWSHKDAQLLLGLAEPYLQGLVAYKMEQLGAGMQTNTGAPQKNKRTKSGKGTDFGLGLLKAAVSSRAEIFGHETPQASAGEKEASQEHIDAILKIARKAPFNKNRE